MSLRGTASPNPLSRTALRPTGLSVLRNPPLAALISSNMFTSLGGSMQLLLHGWLAVQWGHSLWMLAALGATRILPKLLGAVPAGILCDRLPRTRVLAATRGAAVVASLVPLLGFVAPFPLLWVLAASSIGGAVHALDLPAGRGTLGDVSEPADLDAAVAFNSAGGHFAALVGPLIAFGLASWPGRPAALIASGAVLATAAVLSRRIPDLMPRRKAVADGVRPLVRYLRSAPTATLLILVGVAPVLVDKAIALGLPSKAGGGASVGFALAAPEVGGLLAAGVLAIAPRRLGVGAIAAAGVLYAVFVFAAAQNLREGEVLIVMLAAAGVAKLVMIATAQARLQGIVPPSVRGRVFAL
ncbi:MAG: MFS transporter [bacterium]